MKYQHKVIHFYMDSNGYLPSMYNDCHDLESLLNYYGKEGWEFVDLYDALESEDKFRAIFIRKIVDYEK